MSRERSCHICQHSSQGEGKEGEEKAAVDTAVAETEAGETEVEVAGETEVEVAVVEMEAEERAPPSIRRHSLGSNLQSWCTQDRNSTFPYSCCHNSLGTSQGLAEEGSAAAAAGCRWPWHPGSNPGKRAQQGRSAAFRPQGGGEWSNRQGQVRSSLIDTPSPPSHLVERALRIAKASIGPVSAESLARVVLWNAWRRCVEAQSVKVRAARPQKLAVERALAQAATTPAALVPAARSGQLRVHRRDQRREHGNRDDGQRGEAQRRRAG